jgi:uridine kinase
VRGESIEPPVYNMKTGYRDAPKKTFQIPEGAVLVIEGIHALNPLSTQHVPNQEQVGWRPVIA